MNILSSLLTSIRNTSLCHVPMLIPLRVDPVRSNFHHCKGCYTHNRDGTVGSGVGMLIIKTDSKQTVRYLQHLFDLPGTPHRSNVRQAREDFSPNVNLHSNTILSHGCVDFHHRLYVYHATL